MGSTVAYSGCDAWLPNLSLQVRVHCSAGSPQAGWPGRYVNVRRCGGQSMVCELQLREPLELFVERREFNPGYGLLFRVT